MSVAFKKIGFLAKPGKEEAIETATQLLPLLKKEGCEVFLPKSIFGSMKAPIFGTFVSDDTLAGSIDLLIALGGDGTLLKSVRLMQGKKVPVLGIKLGTVGFLAELEKSEMETGIEEILRGNYAIEERLKLKATVLRQSKEEVTFTALNDAVLHTAGLARISDYKISLDGQLVTHLRADGILVATPTGSTAYSFAAGGPIVEPKTHVLVLTPICSQNSAVRPMIVSDKTEIGIEVEYKNSDVLLTMDGQEQFKLMQGDRVTVSTATERAYFVKAQSSNYFKTLRKKLYKEI